MSIVTFKFRIKDGSVGRFLDRHAIACNQVWNFCAATQREAQRRYRAGLSPRRLTGFDLIRLTAGCAAELGLHSDTVAAICQRFAKSRNQHRKCPRFRSSFGERRALGWVPFIPRAVKIDGDRASYLKRWFRFWRSRDIEGEYKTGAFVQDARGRWYVTFQCEVEDNLAAGNGEIGIDLGLKSLASCSDGTVVPAIQHYRLYETRLAKAQRAGNVRRAKAIHAKIANARRHHLHEQSTRIANENRLIAIGDVNASQIAKTRMAKSVLDASWSSFRHMLSYKAARRQAVCVHVDERWSTQTCSDCGSIGGPKGIAGLGVRSWDCPSCGASHDRDVNAAKMILTSGRNAALQMTEIRH